MESFVATAEMLSSAAAAQARWHAQAREVARQSFGGRVFVRGVVEVSNICRENCRYCGMRRENRELSRYRAEVDALADLLLHHRPASVTDINFQAGEDPVAAREIVLPLIRLLRKETDLGFSVALGTLDETLYRELKEAGAGMYILKFETADPVRYRELEAPGTLEERVRHLRLLADCGWFVSSGFISGLPGQSLEDHLACLDLAAGLPLGGCSVSPFIPGEATPLAGCTPADLDLTLNCMAAMRLMNPQWLIPAVSALNLTESSDGYRRGLLTGANLCTINLTPPARREDYLLYCRNRFIMNEERILEAIESAGLEPSTESLARHCWTPKNSAPVS